MKPSRMILASASPRRWELMQQLGVEFEVIASQAGEIQPTHLSPAEICQVNAFRKAREVGGRHPSDWILGADTLVFIDLQVLGKPSDMEAARRMLRELQGREHHVITGVCLLNRSLQVVRVFAEVTHVRFNPLDEAQIRSYLDEVNPLDKAGAYGIQHRGDLIINSIRGSFTNVMGLPTDRLVAEFVRLRSEGLAIPGLPGQIVGTEL